MTSISPIGHASAPARQKQTGSPNSVGGGNSPFGVDFSTALASVHASLAPVPSSPATAGATKASNLAVGAASHSSGSHRPFAVAANATVPSAPVAPAVTATAPAALQRVVGHQHAPSHKDDDAKAPSPGVQALLEKLRQHAEAQGAPGGGYDAKGTKTAAVSGPSTLNISI